jgi:hypothetical protein
MGNGMLGHHSGGICSQMGLNHHHNHHQGGGPNSCGPQDSKVSLLICPLYSIFYLHSHSAHCFLFTL